jgi:hypothetical protein
MKIMRNIKIILYAFLSFVLTTGCTEDYEKLNESPNRSTSIPAHLLLGYTQRSFVNTIYAAQIGGDMGACWAQQWSKVQYNNEERYMPRRGNIDRVWEDIYTLTISEAKAMYDLAVLEENTNLQGIALVMQAIGFQTLVELYGPVAFVEAIDRENLKPAYDDESVVFEAVIQMLTDAVTLLSSGSGEVIASSDLFYAGNTSQWMKFANTLKFRALMRISSTRSVGAELQAIVNSGIIFQGNADNAQLSYLDAEPDGNPIWETIVFASRPEYKVSSVLVDILSNLNDPRLEVYAFPAESDGVIRGKPPGFGLQTTLPNEALGYTYKNISGLGSFFLNPELPGIVMSYSQLNFLMAEAANKEYISGGLVAVNEYYNQGINSSFETYGLTSAASYLAQGGISITSQSDGANKIATQQWIALFGQGLETWTEWRRTKLPVLTPAAEGDIAQIPSRFYYSTVGPSLNSDNYNAASSSIGGDLLTSPLFWQ